METQRRPRQPMAEDLARLTIMEIRERPPRLTVEDLVRPTVMGTRERLPQLMEAGLALLIKTGMS